VEGLPDLDQVDVVLGQELSTDLQNFSQISDALAARGLVHTNGRPAPRANDNICKDPLRLGTDFPGIDNGGLVTWSRYPILGSHKQNWCAHSFPVPAGYMVSFLDLGYGRFAAVMNLHAMPEYDVIIPESAEGIRSYQFGEISGFASELSESLSANGVSFSFIIGGDFNEDAYHLESKDSGVDCSLITDDSVKQKFESLNMDVLQACENGVIGEPTWDPTNNDLADRFSDSPTHEVLDYLIQFASSTTSENPVNDVSVLKTKTPWNGQFCKDDYETYQDTAFALSDHNIVTASFTIPDTIPGSTFAKAKQAAIPSIKNWNQVEVDNAACGQIDAVCWTDANCCTVDYSWTGQGGQCDGIYCDRCSLVTESCGIQIEGSECCGYYDYTSGSGTHCETYSIFNPSAHCVLNHEKGKT